MTKLAENYDTTETRTLKELATITKETKAKPSLVSTGMKCHMPKGYYLELSVRSSTPLKDWIILANGVGIIDADYYNNPDNEGEIFFQLINLSPFPIALHKGDIIGQGIIMPYVTTANDEAKETRTGGFGSTSFDVMVQNHMDFKNG
jgi:dUTP pyrophosphatase